MLSKSDLADPDVTRAWLAYFERARTEPSKDRPQGKVLAIAIRTDKQERDQGAHPRAVQAARVAPERAGQDRARDDRRDPERGEVNAHQHADGAQGREGGDEPAVTKSRQLVTLKNGMTISDNPGIMWPKIEDEAASYRLALGGAIPDTALDYESVALFGAKFLIEKYPELLRVRYKLTEVPATADALLAEIGRRRGALRSGGTIDMHKAADVLIHDVRSGALGRISFESP